MKIIGITGQSGCGKGRLSMEFEKLGYIHADADRIYHELLDSNQALRDELVREFGGDIVCDGKIDRKALGKKVLGKKNVRKLQKLNKIAHKYVCREYVKLIISLRKQGAKGLIIDAPLLIEARLHKLCDTSIFVVCDRETQISRIMARDSISREAALLRINSQKPAGFYARHCEHILYNDSESAAKEAAVYIDKLLYGDNEN